MTVQLRLEPPRLLLHHWEPHPQASHIAGQPQYRCVNCGATYPHGIVTYPCPGSRS